VSCESLSRQTVGDRHRLAQFGRPSRPGDTGLNKPAGGRERLLASPVFSDRTDRQQQRQRLRVGSSLELRDEPADQRLLKTRTGTCADRHHGRAHEFRVQRVLGLGQLRGRRDHPIDQQLRVEVRTRAGRAIAFVGRAHHDG